MREQRADLERSGLAGTLLAAAGAASYGATIVFGRSLAKANLGAGTVLGIRFVVAAALLFALQALAGRPGPAGPARLVLVALGVLYAVESTFFFSALEHGTAAAVALLFYCYPVMVTLVEVLTGSGRPSNRVLAALAASATGSVLVIASGADVSITASGVVFALAAAATFAIYLLAGDRFATETDVVAKAAWVALACGATHLLRGLAGSGLHAPGRHLPAVVANGAATASAFALMFAALHILGPSRTAVVMTLEAFFAIVAAALFLGEPIGGLQLVGGIAILAGAMLIASAPRSPVVELSDAGATDAP